VTGSGSTRATTPWWPGAARQRASRRPSASIGPQSHLLRLLQELAHARVPAAALHVEFDDGFRRGAQAHADRVEAEQDFG
jgi:hypothetical protein